MARRTGPKFKISRREGVKITGTTSPRLETVLNIPPGGRRRARKQTDYGVRLRAKQRVREQYGMLEKGLRRFFGWTVLCIASVSHGLVLWPGKSSPTGTCW